MLAGALLMVALSAFANQSQPAFLKSHLPEASLNATGTFRWFGLKVYDAELWLPPSAEINNLYQQPFALKLTYARSLKGLAIAESSAEEMQRLGQGTPAQRQAWLQKMTALFPNVEAGEAITGVYQPGRGVWFYFNQQPLGTIEDEQFGRAFFAIWLDARTRAPGLRASLLGQTK
jgi:hypothetical protein